jgi:signal transduction histidine kinase/ActR/RegA family two-component response regulator
MGRDTVVPENLRAFLSAVGGAYDEFDSARKLVERALALSSVELHASNAELRGVLQVLPDVLFRVTADNQVSGIMQGSTATSHSALRMLTAPPSPVTEQFMSAVHQVRTTASPVAFAYVHPEDRGANAYEVRLLPFVDSDIIGIIRDVTEHRQAEQDRLILGKLESTGVLAGGIAHDFNNLLTSILLNVDMAESADSPLEEQTESLAAIRTGVHAAQVLTQQLLTFARGGSALRQRVVLSALLRESMSLALSGTNLRGDVCIAEDLAPTVVDAGQIGQVIRNLVLNAREAMSSGGVVSLRADNVILEPANAFALPPGPYVQVRIRDEGCGISAETLARIFDPYFSTKMRGTQKGMGLGLTICHSIVQKHAGSITVDSAPGNGATFTVHLPAERDLSQEPSSATLASPSQRARILVMDDEPMVRRVFKTVLTQIGYDVDVTADGRAAVAAYMQARADGLPFDGVILDLTVKGDMGGEEALRELLANDPRTRAIVMSGYSDNDVMREFERFGFKARLTKPFDRDALRDVLHSVLER